MRQGLFDRDSLLGVERQASLEQIGRERVRVWEQRRKRFALLERQRTQVVARPLRRNGVEIVERRRTENVQNQSQLMMI